MRNLKLQSAAFMVIMLFSIGLMGQVSWKNGYQYESEDKEVKTKFGGRILYDMSFYGLDDDMEKAFEDHVVGGVEFRTIRFFHSGTIYKNINYKAQVDLTGGGITLKDVWVEFANLPTIGGKFRVGHFAEPFRLEVIGSSKYTTFMEPALQVSFFKKRNSGFMYQNDLLDKRMSFQLAYMHNADKTSGVDFAIDEGSNLTARVTGLVLDDKETNSLLHLGAAYTLRKPTDDTYKISARPETHMSAKFISETFDADQVGIMGLEAAFVKGPFSVQGEYTTANIQTDAEDITVPSFYAFASFFLTGENRAYKSSYSGFARVKPKKSVKDGGSGAWEIALRYSSMDLTNAEAEKLTDITLGVNWYLNPATRVMFNYISANLDEVGKTNIGQVRFQIDF